MIVDPGVYYSVKAYVSLTNVQTVYINSYRAWKNYWAGIKITRLPLKKKEEEEKSALRNDVIWNIV